MIGATTCEGDLLSALMRRPEIPAPHLAQPLRRESSLGTAFPRFPLPPQDVRPPPFSFRVNLFPQALRCEVCAEPFACRSITRDKFSNVSTTPFFVCSRKADQRQTTQPIIRFSLSRSSESGTHRPFAFPPLRICLQPEVEAFPELGLGWLPASLHFWLNHRGRNPAIGLGSG